MSIVFLLCPDMLGNQQAIPIDNIAAMETIGESTAITLKRSANPDHPALFTPTPVMHLLQTIAQAAPPDAPPESPEPVLVAPRVAQSA